MKGSPVRLLLAASLPLLAAQPTPRIQGLAQVAPMILQLRVQRLQEALGLPEDKARTVAERWARYDLDFLQKNREMGQLRNRFNEILRGPGSEEDKNAKLRPLLDQFMDLRRQQQDLKSRFEDDIRAGLSPAQSVRLILLVDELQQRLREGIREAVRESRPGKRF